MKELADAGQTIHWLKSIFSPRRTLLVIDMQNDFITGSLPVPGATEIVESVEALTKLDIWYQVFYTQDWHPQNHISFYSNLGLRALDPNWKHDSNISVENIKVYDEVTFRRYPPYKQKLWPDHCIQGSEGAKFHSGITTPKRSQIIQKGTNPLIDAYSAFFDNTDIKGSGDTGLKRLVQDSTEVVVVGLAQDYCVAWTGLDSLDLGLPTTIVTNLQDYLDELKVWRKAKELAQFLVRNSGERINNYLVSIILTVTATSLSSLLYY